MNNLEHLRKIINFAIDSTAVLDGGANNNTQGYIWWRDVFREINDLKKTIMKYPSLEQIEKIIQDQMKAANAYCCESLLKIQKNIQKLEWPVEEDCCCKCCKKTKE